MEDHFGYDDFVGSMTDEFPTDTDGRRSPEDVAYDPSAITEPIDLEDIE
jgi:hypothetical protein